MRVPRERSPEEEQVDLVASLARISLFYNREVLHRIYPTRHGGSVFDRMIPMKVNSYSLDRLYESSREVEEELGALKYAKGSAKLLCL